VAAIFVVYGNHFPEPLETRRAFVQILRVVYSNMALGRRPAKPAPMVCGSHLLDNDLAQLFVEDFPQAQLFTVCYENLSMH